MEAAVGSVLNVAGVVEFPRLNDFERDAVGAHRLNEALGEHGVHRLAGLGLGVGISSGATLAAIAQKLPELAKGLGKGIKEFKKAQNEIEDEFNKTMEEPSKKEKKA